MGSFTVMFRIGVIKFSVFAAIGKRHRYSCAGYTVVELLVTILIVATLAATLGALFVNLLTIQETEREEAYIRENIVEILGNLADNMSVGASISNRCDVKYLMDTGGVSLETGRVVRATQLELREIDMESDSRGSVLHSKILAFEDGIIDTNKYQHTFFGEDTPLISLAEMKEIKVIGDKIDLSYSLVPLTETTDEVSETADGQFALWELTIMAEFGLRDRNDCEIWKVRPVKWNGQGLLKAPVTVKRIVRLWNHQ